MRLPQPSFHGTPQTEALRLASAAPTTRGRWPAIFSLGFRPFFLGGALFAGLAVPYWVSVFFGVGASPPVFAPVIWHAHEMLYGYFAAIVTGFLLTAMPNWTGLPPMRGAPLAALFTLWIAGRLAVACSTYLGAGVTAVVDVAFLVVVAIVLMRDVIRSHNWRNASSVAVIALFAVGNALCHWQAYAGTDRGIGAGNAIGIAIAILLISLVGGRVIPAFTRNWMMRANPGRLPVQYNGFDSIVLAITAIALVAWIGWPATTFTIVALAITGVLHCLRLARWAGDRAWRDRLVLILHVGYAFVPLGFLLLAASAMSLAVSQSAAIHAWTAGAIGVMTIAMMTRVTLGHTGHALVADRATQAIYAAMIIAAVARVAAGFATPWTPALIGIAGGAWMVALTGYVAKYGASLVRPAA